MSSLYVPNTEFNRTNYPHLIGRHVLPQAAYNYAETKPALFPFVEDLCDEQNIVIDVAISRLKSIVGKCKY